MTMTFASTDEEHEHHLRKKRVGKACDSCRIKKTKCDGKRPCSRCTLDNKICVFTEKKRLKDRSHPDGYVELMETRLDLLTKSLEKMIELSRPHLPFLNKLVEEEEEEDEDDSVPINRVVQHLINNEGLLYKTPVEWEDGSRIAADLSRDPNNIKDATKKFYDHNLDVLDWSSPSPSHISSITNGPSGQIENLRSNKNRASPDHHDLLYEEDSLTSSSFKDTLDFNDFSAGGGSLNMFMGNTYQDIFSDFEKDSNYSIQPWRIKQ